jgi:hypothetical protein
VDAAGRVPRVGAHEAHRLDEAVALAGRLHDHRVFTARAVRGRRETVATAGHYALEVGAPSGMERYAIPDRGATQLAVV